MKFQSILGLALFSLVFSNDAYAGKNNPYAGKRKQRRTAVSQGQRRPASPVSSGFKFVMQLQKLDNDIFELGRRSPATVKDSLQEFYDHILASCNAMRDQIQHFNAELYQSGLNVESQEKFIAQAKVLCEQVLAVESAVLDKRVLLNNPFASLAELPLGDKYHEAS